jgi:magnesium-transporting ATPase (P-type)
MPSLIHRLRQFAGRPPSTADAQRQRPEEGPTADSIPWHALPLEQVFARLASDRGGLSAAEAHRRLKVHGPNALPRTAPPPLWRIAIQQLASPLMLVLLAAAAASLAIGDSKDAALIAAVVGIDAALGAWQQLKADRSSRALEKLLEVTATVTRAGAVLELPAAEVVPGDLLWIESGDRVPADGRLVSAHGLEVDESLLTGESLPVAKDAAAACPAAAPLADRLAMVFAGSTVTRGRASAIVTATAARTAVGQLAVDVTAATAGTPPLVARMERFTRSIATAVLAAAATVGLLGVAFGRHGLADMFLFAVALAVSVIPEGLPVSLTIALSIATGRMAARGVIVRRLAAVEGLGSCTMIATDKTGTLTCNELTVTTVELPGGGATPAAVPRIAISGEGFAPIGHVRDAADISTWTMDRLHELARCGVLCNEAALRQRDGRWTWRGDSVDVALLSLGAKLGLEREPLLDAFPQFDEVPFEPEHRFAATFHDSPQGRIACIKGAPEAVLPMCDDDRTALPARHARAAALAAEGLRVLAIARGRVAVETAAAPPRHHHLLPAVDDVVFLGFVGLVDPLRPGVREAVRHCRSAGVRVVMITGDHRLTALAIARQLDLAHSEADVITGAELSLLPPGGLAQAVRTAVVFARVTPRQKLEIVEAARAAGHFVAVTGDGANDAPALRAANIGVAMGRGGTDVARDAAGLVISDDNFATIVAGIEEGRIAYDNVRKVVLLLVSTGAAEMVLVTLSVVTGSPLPLTAAQLLWLNLVTNGIQDVALAFEPGQGDELSRPPRPPDEPVFDRCMTSRVAVSALVMGVTSFLVFRWWLAAGADAAGLATARNATLLVMVLFENVHLGNCRSETRSAFASPPWKSPLLLGGTLAALAVHALAMHLPATRAVLEIGPLPGRDWLALAALAVTILPAIELHKRWCRRGHDTPERRP